MEQLNTTIINYGDGIYAIDQQMVRAFLIVGKEKALLLDTAAVRIDILSCIREITSLPVEVVITHSDIDHIGNLQDFPQAYINEKDMAEVQSSENCRNTTLYSLSEGDVFDVGGRKLKAIFAPGHTPGATCLLDEENKILFSGDSISYGPVFMFGEGRNMPDYLKSLQRFKQMKDEGIFTTVYCCHNVCPISADTVEELVACATGILDKTIAGVSANMPLPTEDKILIGKWGNCSILFE